MRKLQAIPLVPEIGLIDPVPGLSHVQRFEARVDSGELLAPRVVVVDTPSPNVNESPAQMTRIRPSGTCPPHRDCFESPGC